MRTTLVGLCLISRCKNSMNTGFENLPLNTMNSFTSVRELKQQIELFVQRYNADASPFQWVATADSILQKIERIAKCISATGH